MRVLDPGHQYELQTLDGVRPEVLTFVKREGPGYPRNVGHYPGTNMQEVIRALLDRVKYLDSQIHDPGNNDVIAGLRDALFALECRAAERHGRPRPEYGDDLETRETCQLCGHIECCGSCHPQPATA